MKRLSKFWPFILIGFIVLLFFLPVFKGYIPFPGDLLVNLNPYKTESFLGYNPGSYPNKAQGPDVVNEIYPWRYFSVNQIKQGSIPFWNPYNFSGNPQIANFQTAVFYPLNFLYFVLPFNLSWTLLIMLQPFLAGIFMYLFLKKGLGLKDFPSFIGGVSLAFSSYMSVWIEYGNIGHTILWLPLALLFTKYFFKKVSGLNFLAISLILSIAILAGYIQGVFYIFIFCFFYYFYLNLKDKNNFKNYKKHLLFLISLFLPFLITSFQILPTLKLFSESTRGAYTLLQIEKNLSPIINWITIIFPDFFGNPASRNYWLDGTYIERVMYAGGAILFFALFSLFNRISFGEKKFFLVAALASLFIATNLPFVKYLYLLPIPVISTTVATREFSIFIFSMIVLGTVGIEQFFSEKKANKKFIYTYVSLFILIWIFVFTIGKLLPEISENLKISLRNMVIPSIILLTILISQAFKKINITIAKIIIILAVVFDLFYFFNKITPFSPKEFVYPKTPVISYLQKNAGINRFWGYGLAYIPPNYQSVDNTYSPEGNDPLHILRYGELLSSSQNGKLPKVLPRPDANIAPGYGNEDLKNNFYRKRILDLLGVKYILQQKNLQDEWEKPDLTTFPDEQFKLAEKIYPWQIYENKNALPRFFLTGSYILAKDKNQVLSFIYDPNIDLKKILILEKSPDLKVEGSTTGSAALVSYKPDKIIIETETSQNALLFLSDNYYPEWNVKIDGKLSKILIADYTFRAVAVPKGKHKVEFFYESKSFSQGLILSLLGFTFLLSVLLYLKYEKAKL